MQTRATSLSLIPTNLWCCLRIRRVLKNDFYKIDIQQIVGNETFKKRHKLIRLWHERLGHLGVQSMKCFKNQNVAQKILALAELDALKNKFYI